MDDGGQYYQTVGLRQQYEAYQAYDDWLADPEAQKEYQEWLAMNEFQLKGNEHEANR